MGKIKIATLGTEEEEKLKEKEKTKREQKKLREGKLLAKGQKGGERLPSMAPSEEELAKIKLPEEEKTETPKLDQLVQLDQSPKPPKHQHSRSYLRAKTFIDKTKLYPLKDAIDLVKKTSLTKFDGSVEAHINTLEKSIKVNLTFPHSTGKTTRIAIASDEILSDLDKGIANFDVLIATPEFMPKLAKYAKFLGPKGLMPNPKAGTVTTNPQAIAKKYEAGEQTIKTENDQPIIHTVIGKVSFENKDLEDNLMTIIKAIDVLKIRSAFIKATMGPSIRLDLSSLV